MTTGRPYERVSKDQSGRQRSIEEQHADNEAAAKAQGVTLGEPYQDSRSASRYATGQRLDFARLLADLQSGQFGADQLWLWESSRGSRKVGEWVTLIELCAEANVLIHVTTHNRTYDPTNGRDRRSLLEDAVDSEYESSKLSTRILRAVGASAAAGRPHGRPAYGYKRLYGPTTGRMTDKGQEPEPEEAELVRILFRRIERGDSLRQIQRDFEEAGHRTRAGGVFSSTVLRSMALNPTYAGIRIHVKGGGKHHTQRALGGVGIPTVDATWDPIVDRRTYRAVVAILTDPKRLTHRSGAARHLLSGVGVCDAGGHPLRISYRKNIGHLYLCRSGCVAIAAGPLNDLVEEVIADYLSRLDHRTRIMAESTDRSELDPIRDQIADARARLQAAYASAAMAGGISPEALAAIEPVIKTEIAGLEKRELVLSTPSILLSYVTAQDPAGMWYGASISAKRELARFLLDPRLIGQLRIMSRPVDWPQFVPIPIEERIRWVLDSD